jgi:tetrapyrrole methylase family protein / MazG family protein
MNHPCEKNLRELHSLIVRLRGPDGCPWDRTRTQEDIGRYLIEEAYEVLEALEDTPDHLREELGDLLFLILFLTRMAEERGEFSMADVIQENAAKMVRRHPHVFGDVTVGGVEDVRTNWERIKADVEHRDVGSHSLTANIPHSLPTLAKAQRITSRASEAGFDWSDVDGVLEKVEEELAELRAALQEKKPNRIREEIGDLIFTVVNLCRFAEVDAESALRGAVQKFIDRFSRMEQRLADRGMTTRDASQVELDRLWEDIKDKKGPA